MGLEPSLLSRGFDLITVVSERRAKRAIMRKHYACGVAAIALASLAFGVSPSLASSHREAPGITKMPKVDATDLYMFRSYEPGRAAYVTFLANYQGLQGPSDGPNYYTLDPDAIYEIEIDNVGDGHEHLTYQFKMTNALANGTGIQLAVGGKTLSIPLRAVPQVSGADANVGETESYTLTQITGDRRSGTRAAVTNASGGGTSFTKPIDNIGNKTIPDYATYANQFIYTVNIPGCSTTGRVFVGQRSDAFAVNLGGAFDSVNFVPIEGDSAPGAGDGKGYPGGITQSRTNDEIVGKKKCRYIRVGNPHRLPDRRGQRRDRRLHHLQPASGPVAGPGAKLCLAGASRRRLCAGLPPGQSAGERTGDRFAGQGRVQRIQAV